MDVPKMIEVRKILKNEIFIESIAIDDIKSFRAWRKKERDTYTGEATFLVLRKKEGDNDDDKLPTMLIQEPYDVFLRRMSGKVVELPK